MREVSVPKENAVDFIETIVYIYFSTFLRSQYADYQTSF